MRDCNDNSDRFPSGWFILPAVVLGSAIWIMLIWMVVGWFS